LRKDDAMDALPPPDFFGWCREAGFTGTAVMNTSPRG
jgi:hypothetical protein